MFNFGVVTNWINEMLVSVMPQWAATLIECVVIGVILLVLYALLALFYILYERKLCAWFQCRLGPMRVGPWGLLQVFADMFKILIKEIIPLKNTDKFLFALAPYMVIASSVIMFACLPWGYGLQIIDYNIGILFILAVSSCGVIGILLAGWSSNNKYTLIGAMRSGAQIISYELSIGMTMLTMICLTGTMSIQGIVEQQYAEGWNIFRGHIPAVIAFIIYLIAGNAECNRGPFDLPECESELTAGYHTEYSGMHFGYYYLAEYLNLFICAGIATLVFLGGWAPLHIAGLDGFNNVMDFIPGAVWFIGKTFFVVFLLMWMRWTFPRLRIDQILALEWKYLVPISMLNLVLMALLVAFGLHF